MNIFVVGHQRIILSGVLPIPSTDLFASRLNHKTSHYCAWEPDPGAIFIDSFMYDWGQEKLGYAFPPFSVIPMVLRKLIQDEADVIMVVPFWPTQPWFTLLANVIIKKPVVFDVKNDELYLPFRKQSSVKMASEQPADPHPHPHPHPLTRHLRMLAARCSGRHWPGKISPLRSSRPSSAVGKIPPIDSMTPISPGGGLIVREWDSIPFHPLSLKF